MRQKNNLYIFSNGRVASIDKKSGEILWEVKLKEYGGNALSMAIGQITVEDNKIFVGCSGLVFCLSTKDGALLWKNELKGWGYGFVSMSGVNSEDAAAAAASAAATTAASSVS